MDAAALKQHNVVRYMTDAQAVIQSMPDSSLNIPAVTELKAQLEYAEWIFDQSDPAIISSQELDALNPTIEQIKQYFGQIVGNPSSYANASLTQMQTILQRFPYPRVRRIPRSDAQRIIEAIQLRADESISVISANVDRIKAEFETFSRLVNANTTDLALEKDKLTELSAQSAKQANLVNGMLNETSLKLDSLISQKLSDGEARQRKIIDELQADVANSKTEFSNAILNATRMSEDFISKESGKYLDSLSDSLNSGRSILDKIRNIYGIVGGESSAGNLTVSANDEKFIYTSFLVIAGILFVIGSIVSFNIIHPILSGVITLESLLSRMGIIFAIFVPAWYFSSLATKHRKTELAYRSLALKVAAFDPYLANFDEQTRIAIKREMAQTFFSPELQIEARKGNLWQDLRDFEKVITPLESLLEKLRSLATKTT